LIACDKKFLIARCNERGYSLQEAMPCVVRQAGDVWTIDETHEKYPRARAPRAPECLAGTELKKLLNRVGITASPTCSCNARAAHMDMMGCPWVRENLDMVVGWLEEEAIKRGLPFSRMAGKALVRLAVRLAETKANVPPGQGSVHK
jgi:hypothetical protein